MVPKARRRGAKSSTQPGKTTKYTPIVHTALKGRTDAPRAEPLETILGKDIPPIQITHNVNVNVSGGHQKKEKSPKVKVRTSQKNE